MGKMLLSLVVIGGVCGTLLTGTHRLTATEIQLNREAQARALMTQMLGEPLPDAMDIQSDAFGDCRTWLFQKILVNGYAGEIELRVLSEADGSLVMRVTRHRETPGIGDFIDHQRDPWIKTLDGLTAQDLTMVDNVSGATITTNAIRLAAQRSAQTREDYCRG